MIYYLNSKIYIYIHKHVASQQLTMRQDFVIVANEIKLIICCTYRYGGYPSYCIVRVYTSLCKHVGDS